MNIAQEKQYVYDMMREITIERRQLTDIYFQLKKRLEELDELEMRGLEELSIKGYIELQNEKDKELKTSNIQRELVYIEEKVKTEDDDSPSIIPKANSKQKKLVSLEACESFIIEILKDYGIPLRADKIYEEFCKKAEEGQAPYIKKSNFKTNILPRLTQKNERITKPSRGVYQYIL